MGDEDTWWYVCKLCCRAFSGEAESKAHKQKVHHGIRGTHVMILGQVEDLSPNVRLMPCRVKLIPAGPTVQVAAQEKCPLVADVESCVSNENGDAVSNNSETREDEDTALESEEVPQGKMMEVTRLISYGRDRTRKTGLMRVRSRLSTESPSPEASAALFRETAPKPPQKDPNDTTATIRCKLCSRSFSTLTRLKKHVLLSHEPNPHQISCTTTHSLDIKEETGLESAELLTDLKFETEDEINMIQEIDLPSETAAVSSPRPSIRNHMLEIEGECKEEQPTNSQTSEFTRSIDAEPEDEQPGIKRRLRPREAKQVVKESASDDSDHESQDVWSLEEDASTSEGEMRGHSGPHSFAQTKQQDGLASQPNARPNVTRGAGRRCSNCGTEKTSFWRRNQSGDHVCNPCGLYYKTHGVQRPETMKNGKTHRRKSARDRRYRQQLYKAMPRILSECLAEDKRNVTCRVGIVCSNCGTEKTSIWRRNQSGDLVCNPCGLHYKLHGVQKPETMKAGTINTRKRARDRSRQQPLPRILLECLTEDTHLVDRHICILCFQVFPRVETLKRHIRLIHYDHLENITREMKCECPACFKAAFLQTSAASGGVGSSGTSLGFWECKLCKLSMTESRIKFHIRRIHPDYTLPKLDPEAMFKSEWSVDNLKLINNADSEISNLTQELTKSADAEDKQDGTSRIHECSFCDKKYPSENGLQSHLRVVHCWNVSRTCPKCQKKCGCINSLQSHIKSCQVDGKARKYLCPTCGRAFKANVILSQHLRRHDESERKFACNLCSNTFFTPHSLKLHKDKHLTIRTKMCPICGLMFKSDRYLLGHHRRVHTDTRPHKCKLCSATFKQNKDLKRHAAIHIEDKTFPCSLCTRSYKTKIQLQGHVNRTHLRKIKQYVCQLCSQPKEFPGIVSLSNHQLQVHDYQSLGKFECKYCQKKFARQFNLDAHELTHTNERKLACETCGKTFKLSTHLHQHRFTHLPYEELPNVCDVCGKRFGLLSQLRAHKQRIHQQTIEVKRRGPAVLVKSQIVKDVDARNDN